MLSTRQKPRGPRGPKMIQFDLDQVRRLGQLGASDWEMVVLRADNPESPETASKRD